MDKKFLNPLQWRLIYSGTRVEPLSNPPQETVAWFSSHQHSHSYLDIMIVLKGAGHYGHINQVYACQPGTIFFFPPGQTHPQGYPRDYSSFEHMWIAVLNDEVVVRVASAKSQRMAFSQRHYTVITLAECGLASPLLLPKETAPFIEKHLGYTALVAALLRGILQVGEKKINAQDTAELRRRKIEIVRRHIRETGGRNIHLEQLAHMIGYSKFHFARLFKQTTGYTVHAYITRCRSQKVKELKKSGLSAKEIAAELGFSSASAYSHWHKNIFKLQQKK